jgi:hypothetical protein
MRDIGISAGSKFSYQVFAFDNYFTGSLTDWSGVATVTPNTPRFSASASSVSVPVNGTAALTVSSNPAGDAASPSQSGLLLLHRDGKTGAEATAVTVTP